MPVPGAARKDGAGAGGRHNAGNDYKINGKAELEIKLLHQKIDLLREQEVYELVRLVSALEHRLSGAGAPPAAPATEGERSDASVP